MPIKPVIVKIIGETKDLKKAVGESTGLLGGLKKVMGTLVTGAAVAGVVAFGKASVDTFKNVGSESLKLQRVMGGTVQQASAWRGALKLSGVDADTFTKGLKKLSQNVVTNSDAMKGMGIATKDASGHIRPMNDILPQIADRFKAMPAGAEKTALAVQLFGRSGMALLPFLNRGSAGLDELKDKAKQLGVTLDDKAAKSIKDAAMQQRLWNMGIEGVKVQVGEHLLPVLLRLMTFLNSSVMPIIGSVVDLFERYGVVLGPLAGAMLALVSVSKTMNVVQGMLNHTMKANVFIFVAAMVITLTMAIISAYQHNERFRKIVQEVFGAISRSVATAVSFIIGLLKGWLDMQFSVVAGILHVMGKLPGPMGAPFRKAEEAVRKAKQTVDDQINKIQAKVNSLRGKDIPIKASLALNFSPSFTQKDWVSVRAQAGRMAGGGLLDGPGTGTSDSIPVWGSKGEFMVNAESTSRWLPFLKWINAKRYAGGGQIDVAGAQAGYNAVSKIQVRGTERTMTKGLKGLLEHFALAGGAGGGNLGQWIMQAIGITHVPASWAAALRRRALYESGGNPRAINLWDSNARAGIPSMGLMQTVMPTFLAYAWDGLRDIWNPVHNLVAAIRYILSRYGSIFAIDPPVRGYGSGTPYVERDQLAYLHQGEAVLTAAENRRRGQGPITLTVHVNVSGVIATDKRKLANALAEDVRSAIRSAQQRSGLPAIA